MFLGEVLPQFNEVLFCVQSMHTTIEVWLDYKQVTAFKVTVFTLCSDNEC